MPFERGPHERIDAVDVDRVGDHRGLLGGEGVEPCGETGPAARRGQVVDVRMLLLRYCRRPGGRFRARRCSRFISWFKDGSGDMRVTPCVLCCHPVGCPHVTPWLRAERRGVAPWHTEVVADGATILAGDCRRDPLLIAAGDEFELDECAEAALDLAFAHPGVAGEGAY